MKPTVAVEILDRDKTGPGAKAAEARMGKFAQRTSAKAKESGFGKLGKLVGGLSKFRDVSFGSSGLTSIGRMASDANANVSSLTHNLFGAGEAGKGAMGEIAEAAGGAAGAIAGTTVAVIGLGVAGYMLGDKWAKAGAEIDRTGKTLGVSADFLQ